MTLAAGERAAVSIAVSEADTAVAAGSGDVPVLATPRLLALAEAASVAAVEPHLEPGMTTVGTSALVEHRRASAIGAEVTVEAELVEVDGRRLVFSFIARDTGAWEPGKDEHLVVGGGTVERVLVDRGAFLARVAGPATLRPGRPTAASDRAAGSRSGGPHVRRCGVLARELQRFAAVGSYSPVVERG